MLSSQGAVACQMHAADCPRTVSGAGTQAPKLAAATLPRNSRLQHTPPIHMCSAHKPPPRTHNVGMQQRPGQSRLQEGCAREAGAAAALSPRQRRVQIHNLDAHRGAMPAAAEGPVRAGRQAAVSACKHTATLGRHRTAGGAGRGVRDAALHVAERHGLMAGGTEG